MTDGMDGKVAWVRSGFPGANQWTYLDVAARGLISQQVRIQVDNYLDSRMNEGGDKPAMLTTAEDARSGFAALVNSEPDEVALVKNVSDGINTVASALPWTSRHNLVLCEEVEHPSNLFVWFNIRDRFGVEIRRVPSKGGAIDAEALLDVVDENTLLVTVASVTFAPGFRTDIESIGQFCRKRGVFFMIDAAQSVGVLATDLRRLSVDGLAVATQKGLLALYGMGFLYVRREWAEKMRPLYLSRFGIDGRTHEAASVSGEYQLSPGARRFDVGNYNYIGCVAAAASIQQLLKVGAEPIERHVLKLSRSMADGLMNLGLPVQVCDDKHRSHIVSVGHHLVDIHDATPDEQLQSLFVFLTENRVKLSIRRGVLRLSFHLYNNYDDVDRTLQLVRTWQARSSKFGNRAESSRAESHRCPASVNKEQAAGGK